MRKRLTKLWLLVVVGSALALPASALASGGYDYGVVHDYCGGANNWTAFYKARLIANGTATANKLTIDSWVQARDPGHPHWYRAQSWPRVSTTFTPDGSYHHLSLARQASGGVDSAVRIVFKMQAWDHGALVWTQRLHSTVC